MLTSLSLWLYLIIKVTRRTNYDVWSVCHPTHCWTFCDPFAFYLWSLRRRTRGEGPAIAGFFDIQHRILLAQHTTWNPRWSSPLLPFLRLSLLRRPSRPLPSRESLLLECPLPPALSAWSTRLPSWGEALPVHAPPRSLPKKRALTQFSLNARWTMPSHAVVPSLSAWSENSTFPKTRSTVRYVHLFVGYRGTNDIPASKGSCIRRIFRWIDSLLFCRTARRRLPFFVTTVEQDA